MMFLLLAMIPLLKWLELSLESFRIACLVNSHKALSSLISFVDVLLSLAALGLIIPHLTSWPFYMAYAGGYAAGNYTGMLIFERIMKKKV
jgi:uncharacterized protein YebE (UPF0316 family)